jgi:hypothetical protein
MASRVDADREPARDGQSVPADALGECPGCQPAAGRGITAADDRELRAVERLDPRADGPQRKRRIVELRETRRVARRVDRDEVVTILAEPVAPASLGLGVGSIESLPAADVEPERPALGIGHAEQLVGPAGGSHRRVPGTAAAGRCRGEPEPGI